MKFVLHNKKEAAPNIISFIFKPNYPFVWKAGQFLRYYLKDPKADERGVHRYFTIASAPYEDVIMLTVRFDPNDGSTFKKGLKNLKPGQTIEAEGPGGQFILDDPQKKYVFITGGIGITPFRSILLDLDHKSLPINVILLYANRDENIVFKEELEALLTKHPNFKIYYFVDPQRIDEQTIHHLASNFQHPIYYVSGPKPMVEAMENILDGMDIPKDRVRKDYFPGYEEI